VCADADVHLVVLGDETWASPAIIDEAFLIVREALRNALTHSAPQSVVVGVEVTRRELRAWIDDDGKRFAVGDDAESPAAGTGLAPQRARAVRAGGTVAIPTAAGLRTSLELSAQLLGRDHKQRVAQ